MFDNYGASIFTRGRLNPWCRYLRGTGIFKIYSLLTRDSKFELLWGLGTCGELDPRFIVCIPFLANDRRRIHLVSGVPRFSSTHVNDGRLDGHVRERGTD